MESLAFLGTGANRLYIQEIFSLRGVAVSGHLMRIKESAIPNARLRPLLLRLLIWAFKSRPLLLNRQIIPYTNEQNVWINQMRTVYMAGMLMLGLPAFPGHGMTIKGPHPTAIHSRASAFTAYCNALVYMHV